MTSLATASAISSCFFAALALFVNKHFIAHAASSLVVAIPAFSSELLTVMGAWIALIAWIALAAWIALIGFGGMNRSESARVRAERSRK